MKYFLIQERARTDTSDPSCPLGLPDARALDAAGLNTGQTVHKGTLFKCTKSFQVCEN